MVEKVAKNDQTTPLLIILNTLTNLAPTHSIGPIKMQMKQGMLSSIFLAQNLSSVCNDDYVIITPFCPKIFLYQNRIFYMNSGIIIDMPNGIAHSLLYYIRCEIYFTEICHIVESSQPPNSI